MMRYEADMQEMIQIIQGDSNLMFIAGIALVVLLIIVLVVVVFSTKAKISAERLTESLTLEKEKSMKIEALEKALQHAKIVHAGQVEELAHFDMVKKELAEHKEELQRVEESNEMLEKSLAQTQLKLQNLEALYKALLNEHETLQKRFESVQEESSRCQVNNARLLMKLEMNHRKK